MPRGVTCIPKFLKDKLLQDLDDSTSQINDLALGQIDDEDKVKEPPVVKSVSQLYKYIQSLPEC